MKKLAKFILNGSLIALTATVTVVVNVLLLNTFASQIDTFVFPGKTVRSNKGDVSGEKTPSEIADQIEQEGAVLLKNDNLLPLSVDDLEKVNVFGWSATNWVSGGSGSGRVVNNGSTLPKVDLISALNDNGFEVNRELVNFYKQYENERPFYSADKGTLHSDSYQYNRLIEPRMSDYSSALLNNAKEYSDTALVVISRVAGESSDCPKCQYKGYTESTKIDDATRTYLEISTEEESLLSYVGSNYKNVVVIINTTNTMELSFLDSIDGLDACLLVGGTGTESARAIPYFLDGTYNPSGKLTDTYAYDLSTNPSYYNAGKEGEGGFTNGSGLYPFDGKTTCGNYSSNKEYYDKLAYVDYCENIYVGYKWYETADKEGYFNKVNNEFGTGYDGVVQFPFGYGLSYTEFDWTLKSSKTISYDKDNNSKEYEIKVEVENTGEQQGQDVVELYVDPPYTKGGIEKASSNLVSFEKTSLLEPGDAEVLTLTFTVEDLLSYDYSDANKDNHKGYELENGNYDFSLKTDSHTDKDMTNNHLTMKVDATNHYDKDFYSGKDVSNKFTGSDAMDGTSIDGSDSTDNGTITYLSRADFKGTYPEKLKPNRDLNEKGKKYNLYTSSMADAEVNSADTLITTDAKNNLSITVSKSDPSLSELGKKLGKDFNDPDWNKLLDQMSVDEMKKLTLHGYTHTEQVESIGKPKLTDFDGPNQIGSFNAPKSGIGYPNSTVLAQTWNKNLAKEFGYSIGKEAKELSIDGWYGPGMNIHRTPFGGRNYEYYSEDAKLSSDIAAYTILGSNKAGVYCYLKHIALYEQETNRDGIYTFCTEQALREIFLRPFKGAIEVGNAQGVMTSYNRIGTVWAGGSKALITGVLRDEWGFNGVVLTDYADHHDYMNMDQALRAGGDLFMDGWNNNGLYNFESSSNTFKKKLREASKHIIYSWLAQAPEKLKIVPSPWRSVVGVVDGVIGVGCLTWAFFIFAFPFINEKMKAKKALSINEARNDNGETKISDDISIDVNSNLNNSENVEQSSIKENTIESEDK